MSYLVHLRQFEGPLGLLLYLIRKEEMDIFDINIGEITQTYLEHIRLMKELDLEVAGEFIAMAATLIHIKSRMLLPQYDDQGEVVESEDPRKELVQKLLEYQKYQEAAKKLYERPLLGRDVYPRGIREDLRMYAVGEEFDDIILEDDGLFSLISSYRRALRKAARLIHRVRPRVQSIAARVMELKDRLIVGTRVILRDLVGGGVDAVSRVQLLVTFLSMLELGRMGYVTLFQSEVYGDIYIDPVKPIERNVLERVQEFEATDAEEVASNIISEAVEEQLDREEIVAVGQGEGDQIFSGSEPASEELGLHEPSELLPFEIATDEEILAAEAEIGDASDIESHASDVAESSSGLEETSEIGEGMVAQNSEAPIEPDEELS